MDDPRSVPDGERSRRDDSREPVNDSRPARGGADHARPDPDEARRRLGAAVLAVAASVATCAAIGTSLASRAALAAGFAALALIAGASAASVERRRVCSIEARNAGAVQRERASASRLAEYEAGIVGLVREVLPVAIERMRLGGSPDDVLAGLRWPDVSGDGPPAGSANRAEHAPFASIHADLLRSVLQTVHAEEDMRRSAQSAFVNIARRVQAIVNQQLQDLREMEGRHGADPDVFADLLQVDHGTALIGRLADSLAVLGGERPGRQWSEPVALLSVLRGAMSRIIDYRRVEIGVLPDVAVLGPVVEAVIHALAELLDNATRYSPPESGVHLSAQRVQAGVTIVVEDAGVGLGPEAAARAELLLAADEPTGMDWSGLGRSTRLGLSVVGRLARVHDFEVSLRRSAYGGVRALIFLPDRLVTVVPVEIDSEPAAESKPSPADHRGPAANALPQRRRRLPATAPATGTPAPEPERVPQPGLWLEGFLPGKGDARP
jgi:signal transduction histidine kinase